MRQFTKLFIVPISLICLICLPVMVYASPSMKEIDRQLAQLKQEQSHSKQKIQDAKSRIKQLEKQKQETHQQLNDLMDRIDHMSTLLDNIHSDGSGVRDKLDQNAEDLQNAEDRVAKRNQMLADKVNFIYTNGAGSYLDVLMHSTSFSDFLNRFSEMKQLISFDHQVLLENERDQKLIAEKQASLNLELAGLQKKYQAAAKQKLQLVSKKDDSKVQIAGLNKKEQQLNDQSQSEDDALQKLADKMSSLLEEKENLQAELDAANGKYPKPPFSSKSDYSNKPKGYFLSWPFTKNYVITSPYGYRVDPITGRKGSFHDGIDIGAPSGTPIHAAAAGVVVIAQWYGTAGNAIIIDHGHGIRTMYDHMRTGSFRVKSGERVKAGQVIGLVGATGRATGPHLHFGVYYKGKNIDPWQLLRNR